MRGTSGPKLPVSCHADLTWFDHDVGGAIFPHSERVVTFEHDTARPVDGYAAPQLHTHAVIFTSPSAAVETA
jgi:hypothetical protein